MLIVSRSGLRASAKCLNCKLSHANEYALNELAWQFISTAKKVLELPFLTVFLIAEMKTAHRQDQTPATDENRGKRAKKSPASSDGKTIFYRH